MMNVDGIGHKMKPQVILKKWRERIAKAKKRGHFTEFDRELALDWSRCAVGERDCMCEKMIPKNPQIKMYRPWSSSVELNRLRADIVTMRLFAKVSTLGSNFHTHIINDKFSSALKVLKDIEELPKNEFYRNKPKLPSMRKNDI